MKSGMKFLIAGALAVVATGTAFAQEGQAVTAARAQGIVGEQADGYLGFAKTPSPDIRQAVDAVNIKRRAIYTDIAAKQGATVQEVAAARGCEQLQKRVAAGEAYQSGGSWKVKGSGPTELPAVCG